MSIITFEEILPFSVLEISEVILNVECYSHFIHICHKIDVIKRDNNFFLADVSVKFLTHMSSYRSQVYYTICAEHALIEIYSHCKQFKQLYCSWRIEKLNFDQEVDSSKVIFYIECSLHSHVMNLLFNMFAKDLSKDIMNMFINRIHNLYNKPLE